MQTARVKIKIKQGKLLSSHEAELTWGWAIAFWQTADLAYDIARLSGNFCMLGCIFKRMPILKALSRYLLIRATKPLLVQT